MSGIINRKDCFEVRADEGDEIIETLHLFDHPAILWEYTDEHRKILFSLFADRVTDTIRSYVFHNNGMTIFGELMNFCLQHDPELNENIIYELTTVQTFAQLIPTIYQNFYSLDQLYGKNWWTENVQKEHEAVRIGAMAMEDLIANMSSYNRDIYELHEFSMKQKLSAIDAFIQMQKNGKRSTSYPDYRKMALFLVHEFKEWYNRLSLEERQVTQNRLVMAQL